MPGLSAANRPPARAFHISGRDLERPILTKIPYLSVYHLIAQTDQPVLSFFAGSKSAVAVSLRGVMFVCDSALHGETQHI